MRAIEVDFEVWKALTARRVSESHSYNDVLRHMLDLKIDSQAVEMVRAIEQPDGGRYLGRRWLPNGTALRARYKGQPYHAEIRGGRLVDEKGQTHSSASAAAKAITSTSVNGLTFWSAKRPTDSEWLSLISIEKTK